MICKTESSYQIIFLHEDQIKLIQYITVYSIQAWHDAAFDK